MRKRRTAAREGADERRGIQGGYMALIEARNITHTYNGVDIILDSVDLSVERGEFVSILGASGSGKTTLLSILGGIDKPTFGTVTLDGEELTSMSERRLALLRRSKIGFVFQFFNLAPYLTAEQNILVPVYLAGRTQKSVQDKLDSLMEFMGIAGRKKALPAKMSGGEQQRTAIARALIFEPEIIFLDEPTGNLDSMNAEEVMKLLCSVNREFGTTVVQVTHSEQNALYGKRIIRLSDGKIVRDYTVGSVDSPDGNGSREV